MPSSAPIDEQIYEAMRTGKGVPFQFVTGGVKYKAVFQHKEIRDARRTLSRSNTDDSLASASSSPSQLK